MTTKELWARIEADGVVHALERYRGEPTDDPRLARLWAAAHALRKAADEAAGYAEREIKDEATRGVPPP